MPRRISIAFTPLPALLAALWVFCAAPDARASSGTAIGVDLDYAHGLDEPGVGAGTGFNVRLGYKVDLLALQLTPEIGGGYHTFSGSAEAKLARGIVGGRLQFGKLLEPGLYAHLGYGHLGDRASGSHSGATADAGVTLDLTLLPLLDLGVHAGYSGRLRSGEFQAFDSYVLGVHGSLIF